MFKDTYNLLTLNEIFRNETAFKDELTSVLTNVNLFTYSNEDYSTFMTTLCNGLWYELQRRFYDMPTYYTTTQSAIRIFNGIVTSKLLNYINKQWCIYNIISDANKLMQLQKIGTTYSDSKEVDLTNELTNDLTEFSKMSDTPTIKQSVSDFVDAYTNAQSKVMNSGTQTKTNSGTEDKSGEVTQEMEGSFNDLINTLNLFEFNYYKEMGECFNSMFIRYEVE